MKKILLEIKLLVLMLAVSSLAFGQYSGTNPNIAAFKAASVSDTVFGFGPELAVDTLPLTYCSISGDAPVWLQIDLGSKYVIDGYEMIINQDDDLPIAYSFEISTYGNWWTKLHESTVNIMGTYAYDVNSMDSVRYVRVYISDKSVLASINELKVFGKEMQAPTPPTAYSAENITPNGFLATWSIRTTASGYSLSISTDISMTPIVPGYDDLDVGKVLSYEVSGLDPAETYYYALRAYNSAGTSKFSNKKEVSTPKAPQVIVFDSIVAYTYGDEGFELMATSSSGLEITYTNSEDSIAVITGTSVSIVAAGSTTITALQEGNDQYLAAEPIAWNLVVEKKELLIDGATASDKEYDGTPVATITGAILTGVVGNDDVSLTNHEEGTFIQTNVDTAVEVQTTMEVKGSDLDNYTMPEIPTLSADITPAALTIIAEDKSREECTANPEFTYLISGFIAGEDEGVLTTEPTVTCTADNNSGAGAYDILVSGAEAANYQFTFTDGTLTVTADATLPELTVKDITVLLVGTFVEISPKDVVVSASDNCSIADTLLSQSIFTGNDVGVVAVDVTVKDGAGNSTTMVSNVTVEILEGIQDIEGYRTTIYPNPVKDVLTIDTENPGQIVVQITSLNGEIVHSFIQTDASHKEDLSMLKSGVYFVTIKSESQVRTMKIVKF